MTQFIKYAIVGGSTVAIILLIMKQCGGSHDYASDIKALRDSARAKQLSDSIFYAQQIKEKERKYDSVKLSTDQSLARIETLSHQLDRANEKAGAAINDYNALLHNNPDSAKIAAACNPVKEQLEVQLNLNQNLTAETDSLKFKIKAERDAADSIAKTKDDFNFKLREVIRMQDTALTTAIGDLQKVQKSGKFWKGAAKVVAAIVVAETTYILLKK